MMQCSKEGKGLKGTRMEAGLWRVKDTRAAIYQCPSNLRISTVLAAFIYPPFTKSAGERGGASGCQVRVGFGGLLCAIAAAAAAVVVAAF